jgi:hypothetical protein
MTVDEYKNRLRSMTDNEFTAFRKEFGGEGDRDWYVRDFVGHPQHEARLCYILNIATEQQRVNLPHIRAAEATLEIAAAKRTSATEATMRTENGTGPYLKDINGPAPLFLLASSNVSLGRLPPRPWH